MKTEEDISKVYKTYYKVVYNKAYNYTKKHHDACDLAENVFAKYAISKDNFQSEEHIKAWLLRVVANDSKNLIKEWWQRNVLLSEDNEITNSEVVSEEKAFSTLSLNEIEVLDKINRLTSKYREIFILLYKGYNYKEIGDKLNINESTLRTRIMRGKTLLAKEFEEYEEYYDA